MCMISLCFDLAGIDLPRPANQERSTQRTFKRREVRATPRSRGSMVGIYLFRTVLAHPDEHRIVSNIEIVNRVEQLPGSTIHFGQNIRPATVAGSIIEVGMRNRRQMDLRVGYIGEETAYRLSRCAS